MKRLVFFLWVMLLSGATYAQYPLPLRNLWTRPQVHVIFGNYTVSFPIRDINRALVMLRSLGDSTNIANCGLDTSKNYFYELQDGFSMEYHDKMQPILQNIVGTYLLAEGRAVVTTKSKRNKIVILHEITVDVGYNSLGGETLIVNFYDPKTKKMLYHGRMPAVLYKQDLGIDED